MESTRIMQVYNCNENLIQELTNAAVIYNLPLTSEVAQVIASTIIWSMSNHSSIREHHIKLIERTINQIYPNITQEQVTNVDAYIKFVAMMIDQCCEETISQA